MTCCFCGAEPPENDRTRVIHNGNVEDACGLCVLKEQVRVGEELRTRLADLGARRPFSSEAIEVGDAELVRGPRIRLTRASAASFMLTFESGAVEAGALLRPGDLSKLRDLLNRALA